MTWLRQRGATTMRQCAIWRTAGSRATGLRATAAPPRSWLVMRLDMSGGSCGTWSASPQQLLVCVRGQFDDCLGLAETSAVVAVTRNGFAEVEQGIDQRVMMAGVLGGDAQVPPSCACQTILTWVVYTVAPSSGQPI